MLPGTLRPHMQYQPIRKQCNASRHSSCCSGSAGGCSGCILVVVVVAVVLVVVVVVAVVALKGRKAEPHSHKEWRAPRALSTASHGWHVPPRKAA